MNIVQTHQVAHWEILKQKEEKNSHSPCLKLKGVLAEKKKITWSYREKRLSFFL